MNSVWINGRFFAQPITGVQRYATEVTRALVAEQPGKFVIACPTAALTAARRALGTSANIEHLPGAATHYWEQVKLARALRSARKPLLLNLANTAPALYRKKVFTLHDVIFRVHPEGFSLPFRLVYNLLTPLHLRGSRRILTVSDFSASEISRVFNVARSKIQVVHNASSFRATAEDLQTTREHFLAFASAGSNKGFETLLGGYRHYRDAGGAVPLVLVGLRGLAQTVCPTGVDARGRVDDSELRALYLRARAYVSPSTYEGFDLPTIEAQSLGAPVISSDIPVHREVLSDSALYFRDSDEGQLALLFRDLQYNRRSSDRSLRNAERFAWETSGKVVLSVISELEK